MPHRAPNHAPASSSCRRREVLGAARPAPPKKRSTMPLTGRDGVDGRAFFPSGADAVPPALARPRAPLAGLGEKGVAGADSRGEAGRPTAALQVV